MSENTQVANQRRDSADHREVDAVRRAAVTPPVDIVENAHAITLWADLPGVSRERLEIKVHDGALTIEGEATVPVPQDLLAIPRRSPFTLFFSSVLCERRFRYSKDRGPSHRRRPQANDSASRRGEATKDRGSNRLASYHGAGDTADSGA